MESRMIWFPDIEILSVVESCYWKFVVDGTELRLISKERSLLSAIRLDIKKESLSKKYVRKVKGSLFHKQEGIINVNKSLLSWNWLKEYSAWSRVEKWEEKKRKIDIHLC